MFGRDIIQNISSREKRGQIQTRKRALSISTIKTENTKLIPCELKVGYQV
jgi:hypothetical protein